MASFFKGLKDMLVSNSDEVEEDGLHREEGRGRGYSRSLPHQRSRVRDGSQSTLSLRPHSRKPVTISEQVGPTRKERAKDDERDHVYDSPERRRTDPVVKKERFMKLGRLRIAIDPKPEKSNPRSSRYISTSRKTTREHTPSKRGPQRLEDPDCTSPRSSQDARSSSREHSENRVTSPGKSTSHHRRRRRSTHTPGHPNYRLRNDDNIPPIAQVPSTPQTSMAVEKKTNEMNQKAQDVFVINKKPKDTADDRARRKQAEREQVEKELLQREKEDRERQKIHGREYAERQKETAAKNAAKAAARQARREMEEKNARNRRERVLREQEDADREERNVEKERERDRDRRERNRQILQKARSPPPTSRPKLTVDNLRELGADDIMDGDVPSELNRPLGDMTRTFLEGVVPFEAVEEAKRRSEKKKKSKGSIARSTK